MIFYLFFFSKTLFPIVTLEYWFWFFFYIIIPVLNFFTFQPNNNNMPHDFTLWQQQTALNVRDIKNGKWNYVNFCLFVFAYLWFKCLVYCLCLSNFNFTNFYLKTEFGFLAFLHCDMENIFYFCKFNIDYRRILSKNPLASIYQQLSRVPPNGCSSADWWWI